MNKKVCRFYYSAVQKTYEKIYGYSHKGGKIFMFHQVTDDANMWIDGDCAITKRGFEIFINALYNKGFFFDSINALTESGYTSKVFLTFDDIYSDAVENAFPYLFERRIPFCIFISECYIGQDGYISEKQLKKLANEPLCTIGYHTKFHSILRYMSEEKVIDEVMPRQLENIIGKKIEYFAYPYGSVYAVSKKNIRTVKKMGYSQAFSTVRLEIDDEIKHRYDGFLPRINVNEKNYIKYISSSQA